MVGLSIVLENQNSPEIAICRKTTPVAVINRSPSLGLSRNDSNNSQLDFRVPVFLERCFLCRKKLLPGKDIFMYKGEMGFCSVGCRSRQIFMDDQEEMPTRKDNCSLAAMKIKPRPPTATHGAPPSWSPSLASRNRGAARNRGGGTYAF